MVYCGVSHLKFVEICDLCRRYSQSITESSKGVRYIVTRETKYVVGGVKSIELGKLL